MDLDAILQNYHQINKLELGPMPFYTKSGVRLNLEFLRPFLPFIGSELKGDVLDVTGGLIALLYPEGIILESSRANLRCLEKTNFKVLEGALWDAPKESFDRVVCLPPTDKGNARVQAEFIGAYNTLRDQGIAYFALHKDQGAKRYEAQAKELFGDLELIDKHEGWRLSKAIKQNKNSVTVELVKFEALGLQLEAEPGVYAAGKSDPGTAFLLERLELNNYTNKRVLDIGCGYGLISLKAALAGVHVTALDDDLLAVRSTERNAKHLELDIHCIHSDVDSDLPADEVFDLVLMNPPFHIGRQISLEVPRAFIAAAYKHLRRRGKLVFVVNKVIGYEPLLGSFSSWKRLATNHTFKILWAIK
jgi:16S rRNA (guanine1207-N2)-methyltransferase